MIKYNPKLWFGHILSFKRSDTLLVFRTNTAYDRWWEGRKQWDALVNNTRNFILKANNFIADKNEAAILKNYTKAFVLALKEHLREHNNLHQLLLSEEYLNEFSSKNHLSNLIVKKHTPYCTG